MMYGEEVHTVEVNITFTKRSMKLRKKENKREMEDRKV